MNVIGDQMHELITCPFNNNVGVWFVRCVQRLVPGISAKEVLSFNVGLDNQSEDAFPFFGLWQSLSV